MPRIQSRRQCVLQVGTRVFQRFSELPKLSRPAAILSRSQKARTRAGEVVDQAYSVEPWICHAAEELILLELGSQVSPVVLVNVRRQDDLVVDEYIPTTRWQWSRSTG
jgi:hypothetical protein